MIACGTLSGAARPLIQSAASFRITSSSVRTNVLQAGTCG